METVYNTAYDEKFVEMKEAVQNGSDPDLAIMGICSKQTELLKGAVEPVEIKAVYATLTDKEKARVKALEKNLWWSVGEGACLLWGIQQKDGTRRDDTKGNSFFSRVSMRKGPGDVARGTFKKD